MQSAGRCTNTFPTPDCIAEMPPLCCSGRDSPDEKAEKKSKSHKHDKHKKDGKQVGTPRLEPPQLVEAHGLDCVCAALPPSHGATRSAAPSQLAMRGASISCDPCSNLQSLFLSIQTCNCATDCQWGPVLATCDQTLTVFPAAQSSGPAEDGEVGPEEGEL